MLVLLRSLFFVWGLGLGLGFDFFNFFLKIFIFIFFWKNFFENFYFLKIKKSFLTPRYIPDVYISR